MKIGHYRFALIYLRRKLYQLHSWILFFRKRIQNTTKPPQKKPAANFCSAHTRRRDGWFIHQKPKSGEGVFTEQVKLYKLLFSQFFLLQCTIFQHHIYLLTSFLPHNKSRIFSGIFQGQQMQYLRCFLIMLKGTLSSKYSALLPNI